jgi:hypothetical protein
VNQNKDLILIRTSLKTPKIMQQQQLSLGQAHKKSFYLARA